MESSVAQGEARKVIEFRTGDDSPVETDETYREVWAKLSKRLITNGSHAVEVWRLRKRDRLLAAYEEEQKRQQQTQKTETVPAPIRKTDEVEIAARIAAAAQATIETNVQVIDEEAEAQEFLNVAADPVDVDPNDWFECVLKRRLPALPILIGEFSNGQTVWIHEREVTRLPGHSLCLPPGTPLFVRMEINKPKKGEIHKKYQYRALEAQIDGEPVELHAQGTVTNWRGSYGGARRDCGCNIFLRTEGADVELGLNAGDRVEFDLMYSEKRHVWFGCNIRPTGEKE